VPAGFFAFGALALALSELFVVPAMAWFMWLSVVVRRIRCPSCGTQVGTGGSRVPAVNPIIARQCRQCGWDLSRENGDFSRREGIELPVIVATVDELLVFEDIVSAEQYVDPFGVERGEYCGAFDAKGRKLRFRVAEEWASVWRPVVSKSVVIVPEGEALHEAELRTLLLARLPTYGVANSELQDGTLTVLLPLARRVALSGDHENQQCITDSGRQDVRNDS
jgi:hypothetical protein